MNMKQVAGQIDIFSYLEKRKTSIFHCGSCVCKNCLYWWSSRCPYGKCFDDHRARIEPYEKVHPDRTPRKSWSDWDKPGEQAHWCRGGILYPVSYCEYFVKYEGSTIEDCVAAPVQTFQDGYINCSLKESIGCEECIRREEDKESRNQFDCPYMTDSGCERMITAKSLMLDAIAEGEDIEMCKEQCCIGCTKTCGYRCGQVNNLRKEE